MINDEHKRMIEGFITMALKSFANHNFSTAILSLLALKNIVSDKVKPEDLTIEFVDLMMDDAMWEWVDSMKNKKDADKEDWEALEYAINDLKYLKQNDMIFDNQLEGV